MIAYLEYDGEVVPYFSEHPLLHDYEGYQEDDTFLSPEKINTMINVLDDVNSNQDNRYRDRVMEGTLCYAAAVISDFMECIGSLAQKGDKSKACVHIVVPC